jgi:uncharacterized protein
LANIKKVDNAKSLLKFFLIVYGLSFPLWLLETIIDVKGLPLDIPVTDIVAAFTPLIAACILVYKQEGRIGVNKLMKRIFDFSRIKKKIWFVPVIFLPFVIYFLIYLIIYFAALPLPSNFQIAFTTIPVYFLFFFLGAVAEEIGYMGYVIEPTQSRFGALSAGILVGIPWAVWHYPSIIQQGHDLTWISWATLGTIAVRILIVWIYNNTGKSLFACILFHTMLNLGRPLFPKDQTHNPLVEYPYIHYPVFALFAVVIVVLWGSKTLARFRYSQIINKKA